MKEAMITTTATEVRDASGQVIGLYQQVPGRRTYSARYLAPNGAVWCDLGVALTRPEVVEAALREARAKHEGEPIAWKKARLGQLAVEILTVAAAGHGNVPAYYENDDEPVGPTTASLIRRGLATQDAGGNVRLTKKGWAQAALHTTGATRVTYPHYLLDAVQAR